MAGGAELDRDAGGFRAQDDGKRDGEIGARGRRAAGDNGGKQLHTLAAEQGYGFRRGQAAQERDAENGSGGGTDGFGIVRTDGAGGKQHAGNAEGFRGAENHAEIAGVLEAGQNQKERGRSGREKIPLTPGGRLGKGEKTGAGLGRDEGVQDCRRDLVERGRRRKSFHEAAEANFGVAAHEQSRDRNASGDSVFDHARRFEQNSAAVEEFAGAKHAAHTFGQGMMPAFELAVDGHSGRRRPTIVERERGIGNRRNPEVRCSMGGERDSGDRWVAKIVQVNREAPELEVIARAAELIRKGEVVAVPTDTFYGLAANPFDAQAVERVFAIKGRPRSMPLLLLVDSVERARGLTANPPEEFKRLARRFWPGPLTIVVEASAKVPAAVTGNTGRIGLRWPRAAEPVAIVQQAGVAITGTSANRTGERECSTAEEVERQIGTVIPLILDGCDDGRDSGTSVPTRASTVIDLREDGWEVLREGALAWEEIARVIGTPGTRG